MTELAIHPVDGIRTGKRRIFDWIRRRLHAIVREHRARRPAKDLARFDDHMLRDIGLTRDQVEFAVRNGLRAVRNGLRREEASRWRG